MELIDYSEKSFVLYGEETRNSVSELKALGGLFNPKLTHPITKERISGWLFSKRHSEKLKEFLRSKNISTEPIKIISTVLEMNSSSIPEMNQVPGFTMIVPKLGNKVKMSDNQGNVYLFEIIEVKPNIDGYIFDFKAKKEDMIFDFVMVGKEWRIIKTNKPFEMNFV